jgi:hypothetical protein
MVAVAAIVFKDELSNTPSLVLEFRLNPKEVKEEKES